MKSPEKYLEEKHILDNTQYHSYDYIYKSMTDIIKQVQKDAYDEGYDDGYTIAAAH